MLELSNRVHLFAHPAVKDKLNDFFTNLLGCKSLISPDAPGLSTPVLAYKFSNGASLSVEFTEEALDDKQARGGAWFELKTDDPADLKKKVLEAGLPRVEYAGNDFFYFQAPGGQVFRIVSPGEV
jgi:hypothetical protein